MLPELTELFDRPGLLVVAFTAIAIAGVAAGMTIEQVLSNKQQEARWLWRSTHRSRWQRSETGKWAGPPSVKTGPPDAADQLRIVMGATFAVQPLLNKSEARLFKELDRFVIGCNPDWQVMAQVSLGEILRSKDAEAYGCINSKRVDLLLVDSDCHPRHVIEYHGTGHYQGTAAARDAVKREALRRAGIGYHEVLAGQTTPTELRRLVEQLVDRPKASTPVSAPASLAAN